ncbi:MAG: hypothetical protein Q8909_06260 [Bacteroidota bacterium]|nr:hypothetical protein [Bacteroidota bacterium]
MRGILLFALYMTALQAYPGKPVVNRILEKKRGKQSLFSKMEYKIVYYTEDGKHIASIPKEQYQKAKVGDTIVYTLAYRPR